MTDRTFQQLAVAFGSTTAQVVCQIDGNTVYSGPVTTLDQPLPALPDPSYVIDNAAWTWQGNADYAGTQTMTIQVTDADLILAETYANNPYANVATRDDFQYFYSTDIDGVAYQEPLSDQAINGVAQNRPADPSFTGQWWWTIPAGSTFTATLNMDASPHPIPPTPPVPPV